MTAVSWSLSVSDGHHYAPHLKVLIYSAKVSDPSLHGIFITIWAKSNALLILIVISTALQPILNSNKKIT